MKIKSLTSVLLLLMLTSCGVKQNSVYIEKQNSDDVVTNIIDLPKTFKIEQNITIFGDEFDITNKNSKIGKVEEEVLNFTPTFKLYNKQGKLVAKSEQTMFSFVTQVKIFDNMGKYIGKFEQEVFENLFSLENTYSIFNSNNVRVGTSRKLDLFSTEIKVYNKQNNLITEIKRPMINLVTDTWDVKIIGDIDTRIIVFIPCYKTYSDEQRKNDDD